MTWAVPDDRNALNPGCCMEGSCKQGMIREARLTFQHVARVLRRSGSWVGDSHQLPVRGRVSQGIFGSLIRLLAQCTHDGLDLWKRELLMKMHVACLPALLEGPKLNLTAFCHALHSHVCLQSFLSGPENLTDHMCAGPCLLCPKSNSAGWAHVPYI